MIQLAALSTVVLARPPQVQVCYDWGCKSSRSVSLTESQWNGLRELFSPLASTPAQERRLIAVAIARLEEIVGKIVGTHADLSKNGGDGELAGQMDCIDESLNTTGYLNLLEQAGWLRWHQTFARARRSWFLLDQHYTAVVEEIGSRDKFAVDSWYGPNGAPPEIQPLRDWYFKRRPRR